MGNFADGSRGCCRRMRGASAESAQVRSRSGRVASRFKGSALELGQAREAEGGQVSDLRAQAGRAGSEVEDDSRQAQEGEVGGRLLRLQIRVLSTSSEEGEAEEGSSGVKAGGEEESQVSFRSACTVYRRFQARAAPSPHEEREEVREGEQTRQVGRLHGQGGEEDRRTVVLSRVLEVAVQLIRFISVTRGFGLFHVVRLFSCLHKQLMKNDQ